MELKHMRKIKTYVIKRCTRCKHHKEECLVEIDIKELRTYLENKSYSHDDIQTIINRIDNFSPEMMNLFSYFLKNNKPNLRSKMKIQGYSFSSLCKEFPIISQDSDMYPISAYLLWDWIEKRSSDEVRTYLVSHKQDSSFPLMIPQIKSIPSDDESVEMDEHLLLINQYLNLSNKVSLEKKSQSARIFNEKKKMLMHFIGVADNLQRALVACDGTTAESRYESLMIIKMALENSIEEFGEVADMKFIPKNENVVILDKESLLSLPNASLRAEIRLISEYYASYPATADVFLKYEAKIIYDHLTEFYHNSVMPTYQSYDVQNLPESENIRIFMSSLYNELLQHLNEWFGMSQVKSVISQKFNPKNHAAYSTIITDNPNMHGIIVDEIYSGYILDEKYVRYPMVVVAKYDIPIQTSSERCM